VCSVGSQVWLPGRVRLAILSLSQWFSYCSHAGIQWLGCFFYLVYQFVSLFTIGFRLETISFGWFQEIPFALWLFEFLKWPTSGDSLRAEGTERGRRNACSWYSSPGSYDGFNLRAGDCGICSMLKFVSFFFWWFFLCLFVAMTIVQPVFRNCQKKTGKCINMSPIDIPWNHHFC